MTTHSVIYDFDGFFQPVDNLPTLNVVNAGKSIPVRFSLRGDQGLDIFDVEFGLVYANDWFLVPYTLPVGAIAWIRGMAVTNVFGEHFWIEAAGSGEDDDWQRWSMFTLTRKDMGKPADTSLLLLPTMPKIQEGKPREQVVFIRDKLANMVWSIEKIIQLASGDSNPGAQAGVETLKFYEKLLVGLKRQLEREKTLLEEKGGANCRLGRSSRRNPGTAVAGSAS